MHFGEKYASLRLSVFEEPWRMRWGTEQTTACYGVSTNSNPLVLISAFSPRRMAP